MGARALGVECTNPVDKGEAQGDGSDREGRLGASLRCLDLGGGRGAGLIEEEYKRGGRVPWQGLQSKRASCIEWESLVCKW